MREVLVIALTIALVCTGLALVILHRKPILMRVVVAMACGSALVTFCLIPFIETIGYSYGLGRWFGLGLMVYAATTCFFFTRHGFVLGVVFKNTVPLIQAVPQAPTPMLPMSTTHTVNFSTGRAKTVWEI